MKRHPAALSVAVLLGLAAAFFAWFGGFTISKVFAEHNDNPDSTYLTIGGASLTVSALFAAAALLTLSRRPHRLGWLVLAAPALLASVEPYSSIVGPAGYAANAALVLLAVGSIVAHFMRRRWAPASRGE